MPTEGTRGHAQRGRRNPQIAQAIQAEPEPEFEDEGPEPVFELEDQLEDEEGPEGGVLLLPGDVVAASASISVDILGKEAWFKYGLQTRAMEGESEAEVFERAEGVVNTRVLNMADAAFQRIQTMQAQHDAELAERPRAQSSRLQPRRSR